MEATPIQEHETETSTATGSIHRRRRRVITLTGLTVNPEWLPQSESARALPDYTVWKPRARWQASWREGIGFGTVAVSAEPADSIGIHRQKADLKPISPPETPSLGAYTSAQTIAPCNATTKAIWPGASPRETRQSNTIPSVIPSRQTNTEQISPENQGTPGISLGSRHLLWYPENRPPHRSHQTWCT